MNSRIGRSSGVGLFAGLLLTIAGCGGAGGYGGGGGGSPPSGTITTITISPATATIAVNGTQQYTAVGKDSNGNTVNGATFTWASSVPAVATVNNSGLATGVAAGTTTITASITYNGGIYGMGVTYTSNPATLTVSASAMAMGTMAMGRAVEGAMVNLKDSQGQSVVAMTDGNGRYQLSTSGLSAPFLLKAQDNQGHVLFSFADQSGVINITPVTDLMVRMWYGVRGATPYAAFVNPAAHPAPQMSELAVLNKILTGVLGDSLSRAGLDPAKFDLIATPFAANSTGFDLVLDNTVIGLSNGQFLVHDRMSDNQTAIGFDQARSEVVLTFTRHASSNATVTNSTVALK